MSEDLQVDYESYEWTKLDPESEEAKKLVVDYFGQETDFLFDGKELHSGKIFK